MDPHSGRALDAHADAIMKLETAVTPQLAAALQATENIWRRVRENYGTPTGREVAALLSPGTDSPRFAARLREAGKIIGVKRLGRFEYPGFQFDLNARRIKPVIEPLLQLTERIGWDQHDLVLWLMSPTTYFEDDGPPIIHLEDDGLLEILENAATIEW